MLTARRANIIGDLNLGTCDRILRRTGAPDHVRVFLHPRMIHGKAIVADGRAVQIGSANLTLLSHTTYAEVDLYCREPQFALAVEQAILRECDNAVLVRPRIPYRRAYFYVETAIIRYQSRRRKPAEPAAVTPA
jgi:phosphatidylserine/phosphatidylglycerophosphate/cardiolipin synthase-like enzyme